MQVKLNQVTKIYPNGVQAVQPANFTIEEGELIVLVGPSGCGKSTLLRMVAGLEDISGGDLMFGDKRMNDIDPADRDIAMVFQNYALYPHMSVYDNMAYGLKNRGTSKDEIKRLVDDAAKTLNLTEYMDRRPSQLSGGQRQRVAMGRAIVRSPFLFLFDEPLSNLDAKLRNQMRVEIKNLQRRLGVTSIYVTHDQVEAMTLADRIVVLNGGEIEQIGTPSEIYHDPASVFVASFMGAPPMNLIDVQAADNQGGDLEILLKIAQKSHDDKIQIGIRPEKVEIFAEKQDHTIPFNIDFIEELGAARLLHGKFANHDFVIHQNAEEPVPADHIHIHFVETALHIFDGVTGKRI